VKRPRFRHGIDVSVVTTGVDRIGGGHRVVAPRVHGAHRLRPRAGLEVTPEEQARLVAFLAGLN
jgi:hypothetical protein